MNRFARPLTGLLTAACLLGALRWTVAQPDAACCRFGSSSAEASPSADAGNTRVAGLRSPGNGGTGSVSTRSPWRLLAYHESRADLSHSGTDHSVDGLLVAEFGVDRSAELPLLYSNSRTVSETEIAGSWLARRDRNAYASPNAADTAWIHRSPNVVRRLPPIEPPTSVAEQAMGSTARSTSPQPSQSSISAWPRLAQPAFHPLRRNVAVPELELPDSGRGDAKAVDRVTPAKGEVGVQLSPPAVDDASDAAMQTVTDRVSEVVDHAFSLAARNAVFSAREQLLVALRTIAEALDVQSGTRTHTAALEAALVALREAEDFVPKTAVATVDVSRVVEAHRTPILQGKERTDSPLVARQLYYQFAQHKLAEACGHNPAASRALFGLGKLHATRAAQPDGTLLVDGPEAVVYFQAALSVDPKNYLAANELGVLLARYGQWDEARQVLQHCVSVHPLPEAWYNLAIVHERLGQTALAQRARQQWQLAKRSEPQPGSEPVPAVQVVDRQTFSRWTESAPLPTGTPPRPAAPAAGAASSQAELPWWQFWKKPDQRR